MIPTGVSEDIYIQFTPAVDEYKYYYDSVRIHCDGDKILIPIHAFPVINSNQDELFPKFIDMGTGCVIGKSYIKQLQVESNCPVDFEYVINVVKPHPEIHVSPLAGDFLGLQTTCIDFTYNPRTNSTAECEIEVKTSEFDSQPKRIRIVGNAAPPTTLPKQVDLYGTATGFKKGQIHDDGNDWRDPQPKTLLQVRSRQNSVSNANRIRNKTGVGASTSQIIGVPPSLSQLHNAPLLSNGPTSKAFLEQNQSNAGLGSLQSVESNRDAQQSILNNLKGMKLTEDEQVFIKQYRRLEELEREKGIKFFQSVGDPPHTKEFVDGISGKRQRLIDNNMNEMRRQDCTRYTTQLDRDMVVVDTSAAYEIAAKPKWDVFENNHFAMRRRLVNIFLRVANKVMCRLRAGRRLNKLKGWIEMSGIRTREDMRVKVAEDFKLA